MRSGNHQVCLFALASEKRTVVARASGMNEKQATHARKAKVMLKRILPVRPGAGNAWGTACASDLNAGVRMRMGVRPTGKRNPPASAINVNNSLKGQIWSVEGMAG